MASNSLKKICKVCYYYNQSDQHRLWQLYTSPSGILGCFDPRNHNHHSPRPELVVMVNSDGYIEPMKCFGGENCSSPEWCPFAHSRDEYLYTAFQHVPGRMSLPTMPAVFPNAFRLPDPGGGFSPGPMFAPQLSPFSTHPPPALQVPTAVVRVPDPSVIMSASAPHPSSQQGSTSRPSSGVTASSQQRPASRPSSNVTASSQQRPASRPSSNVTASSQQRSTASCENFPDRIKTDLKLEIIQQELTRDNYKEKMNNLICWEEMNHVLTLGSKCNGSYKLVVYERKPEWMRLEKSYFSHFGHLEGISPDQVAYASQASEAVYIVKVVNAQHKMEVRADISGENFNQSDDKMYIAFKQRDFRTLAQMFPELLHGQHVTEVTVEFEVNHRYFNNLIKAVNGISQEVVNKLMPQSEDFVQPEHPGEFHRIENQYHLQMLDSERQLAAMESIVCHRNDSPVMLLKGSFGTGKTRVLALAAYVFTEIGKLNRQPARVLVCAHHQHSADNLISSYFGNMISDGKHAWDIRLVRLSNRPNVKSMYNQYYMSFQQLCKLASSHDLQRDSLVVVSTFLTSLSFRGSRQFPRGFFTHILIDEGGQTREPEALAPLCLATKNTKIVIAGDPCQVGPAVLVLGDEARENGLKLSLMDRLRIAYHNYGSVAQPYVVTLLKNYRCHKSILDIPNQLFYRSELIPNADLQRKDSPYPLVFVCSSLKSSQPRPEFEAGILLNQVSHWLEGQTSNLDIKFDDISVVTTTRTQLVETRKVANRRAGLYNLKILTTYTIQGEEFKAVFWSTTEPITEDGNSWNPLISPCDRYVFNTVLTRAKSLVVVVGSPLVLLEIEKHMVKLYEEQGKCWSLYIKTCLENGTFIIPSLVESSVKAQDEFKRSMIDRQWIKPQSSETNPRPLSTKHHHHHQQQQQEANTLSVNAKSQHTVPKTEPKLSTSTTNAAIVPRERLLQTVQNVSTSAAKSTQSNFSSVKQGAIPNLEKEIKSSGPIRSKAEPVHKSPRTTKKSPIISVPPSGTTSTQPPRVSTHVSLAPQRHPPSEQTPHVPLASQRRPPSEQTPHVPLASQRCPPSEQTPHVPLAPQRRPPSEQTPHVPLAPQRRPPSEQTPHVPLAPQCRPPSEQTPHVPLAPQRRPPSEQTPHVPLAPQRRPPSEQTPHVPLAPQRRPPSEQTSKSKRKRKATKGRAETTANNDSQGANFTKDDFPTLADTAAVRDKVPKYTPKIKPPIVHTDYYWKYKDKLNESLLREKLTRENYKEKFHQLLCWEEMEHEELLEKRCNGEYEVTFYQRGCIPDNLEHSWNDEYIRYGHIFTDDVDTLAYAKQASEGSSIIFESKNIVIKVKHVFAKPPKKVLSRFNAIVFAMTQSEVQKLTSIAKSTFTKKLPVMFDLKHSYFRGLHEALNRLPESVVPRIMPNKRSFADYSTDDTSKRSPWHDLLDLDYGQLQALNAIMRCSPEIPFLLAGPFGTGKTRLLARAAYEFLKESREHRVLICAHHQASVDTFIEYFGQMKYDEEYPWFVKFIRVTPNDSYRSQTKQKYPELYRSKNSVELLFKYRLVVTTLGIAPSLLRKIRSHPAEDFFTHILIDEGAQTREPETLGPLCFAGKDTKIIIAGDHYQVGPQLLVLGEKAQKHGLQISLLERLHKLYESIGDVADDYSASLVTNYRCHSGLLMLPSSLFYASTLQCRVDRSIPHPSVSFPLQFYCPTANFQNVSNHPESTDKEEARALLDVVKRFCSEWPEHEWGKLRENMNRLCIMSPSADQCALVRNLIHERQHYHSLKGIEVLKAYEIQGREFRAIFIGTSEATDASGRSMNPTKSVCDPYVFNTAITRSQSLVVAVGNPFLLLSIEESMVTKYAAKTGNGDRAKCWSQYMKRCLECNTLYILKPPKKENHPNLPEMKELLFKKVFSDSVNIEEPPLTAKSDSILKAYRKTFESIPACQKLKLTLSRVENADIAWKFNTSSTSDVQSTSDETESEPLSVSDEMFDEKYECIINIIGIREAEAIPFDASKSVVTIKGSKNRIGAFNGDTVQVGVFKDSPEGKHYGRVMIDPNEPIISHRQGNDRNFLCRVFHKNPIVLCPVDRKNPNFLNLPRLSRNMLTKKKKETTKLSEELQTKDVVVFNPKSIEAIRNGDLPQIQNVIPLSVAKNMLFIVSFIQWNTKYRSPLGMVICAIPKGTTAFRAERLLKLQHNVQYNDNSTQLPTTDALLDPTTGPLFDCVFTIDPNEAVNLDDALSLKRLPSADNGDVFELGVHIVNVAKHLTHDSKEDEEAKQMGTSVYGGTKGKIMHMLSVETRKRLSLTPNCVRDVISVIARVTIDKESIQLEEPQVKMAQIKSTVQLTYSNAQEIMDGKKPTKDVNPQNGVTKYNSDKEQPTLSKTLQLLYKIACCMKHERLKTDAAYCYDINELEDASCWQTHMLVEELMIWANSTVAKRIHECFPDSALLRRQGPPNEEAMDTFILRNRPLMSHSCGLSHYLALYALDDDDREPPDLVIPRQTLAKLHEAKDVVLLISLLTSDRYYPQLAAANSQLKSNFQRAEYCCTNSRPLLDNNDADIDPPSKYRHFSLCLDEYTHFTSPMRRYCDVMVQRMVQRMVQGMVAGELLESKFNREDVCQVCRNLNSKDRNASQFEKSMKNVRLAVKFSSSSEVYNAFISQVKKGTIELFFPDFELNSLPTREKKIRVRHIGPFDKKTGDVEETSNPRQLYHWKIKMTSMNEEQGTHVLSHMYSCLKLEETTSDQNKADSNISLEVLCLKNDDSQTMCKRCYTAPLPASMVKVSPTQWRQTLEFVKNPAEDKMADLKAILPDVPPSKPPKTECMLKEHSPFLNYMLRLSLSENSSLKVWMTWALQEAHITPIVQMIELSPAVRICVQHNSHPAQCFSEQDLTKASRKRYQNIQEYLKLWERVLLAEAAEKSVKEFQPVIIQDVTLEWPKLSIPSNCIDEVYYSIEDNPDAPLKDQSVVMKQSPDFIEQCSEFFKFNEGDLVCIRYGTDPHSSTRAVFHMVVHKVSDDKDKIYMKFIGESNCRISEKLVKENTLKGSCELQLIPLSTSYQRVYKGLLKLDKTQQRQTNRGTTKPISKLVSLVALGKEDELKRSKVQDEATKKVFDGDSLATTLWGREGKPLNKGQKKAVQLVLDKKFQLIQGPPGTGKSETGAHIAYMFAMANKKVSTQHCVLYCGPSNKSVDVVMMKLHTLCRNNQKLKLKILRIYGRSIERRDHISPQTHQGVSSVSEYNIPEELANYALHKIMRGCKDIKEVCTLNEIEDELKELHEAGEIPNGQKCMEHHNALLSAEKAFLKKHKFDIVLCTCNEAASHRVEYISPRQCIIDESGMATEPESVAPISLCEHVVLIGDHKQLQPVIDYGPAKENGLTTSLFERYAEKFDGFTETLRVQYRMHEAICEFPSEHFYEGMLVADDSVKNQKCKETEMNNFWPGGADCPILFCDVVGEESQSDTGRHGERKVGMESKSNRKEAEKVVEIVRVLHHVHKVALNQIAVLTPYSAQREEIKNQMTRHPDLVEVPTSGTKASTVKVKVKVASITESQGDEYGIVILSTVRSQPIAEIAHREHIQPDRGWLMEHLGFITDKHQINVGITRSKYGLVIVGNKMLLEYDDTWEKLIQHYKKRKCVIGAKEFPHPNDLRRLQA